MARWLRETTMTLNWIAEGLNMERRATPLIACTRIYERYANLRD